MNIIQSLILLQHQSAWRGSITLGAMVALEKNHNYEKEWASSTNPFLREKENPKLLMPPWEEKHRIWTLRNQTIRIRKNRELWGENPKL